MILVSVLMGLARNNFFKRRITIMLLYKKVQPTAPLPRLTGCFRKEKHI